MVTGAVESAYILEVFVAGLTVSTLVDTGSQSTIISRAFLHKVFAHLRKPPPRLQEPCTKFKGKKELQLKSPLLLVWMER